MANIDWAQKLGDLLVALPIFLVALSVHEFAHAWVAKRMGDTTAERLNRLTLNPLAHLDPLGTVMFIISSLSGFGFGWAKPVPVELGNTAQPLKAMFWVSVAGPLSNLLQALAAAVVLVLLRIAGVPVFPAAIAMASGGLTEAASAGLGGLLAAVVGYYLIINIVLMMFNLLPIPPLDGGHALMGILPWRAAGFLARIEPFGFFILLALLTVGGGFMAYWIGLPLGLVLGWLQSILG